MDRQNNWWIQFSLIYVFYLINCKGQINIQPADVPLENSPWTLECSLSSIVSTVSITNPSGTIVGFCEPTGVFPSSCTPNAGYTFTINETSNTVSMTRTITNSETGNWTCKHGADNDQYILSSPLPSRNFPDSSTSFVSHSMSATAGSKLISGTEHNFTFHYGCLSTNLKFVWTTVPGSSSEDTLNTISNGLTCTTNTAYMSTLDSTAAILQSISSKGTTLSVSVFVNGYYNLPALVEYTFDVTFSPGPTSQMGNVFTTEITTTPITEGLDSTTDILVAATSSYLNAGTISVYSNNETAVFHTNIETTTPYNNIETTNLRLFVNTTNVYAYSKTNEIQRETSAIISNAISNYQSMFVTTAINNISGSLDTTGEMMSETFVSLGYYVSSFFEISSPSILETSNVFPETFLKASISYLLNTQNYNVFDTTGVSIGSSFTTDSSRYSMMSMTISQSYVSNPFHHFLSTGFIVSSRSTDKNSVGSESLILSLSVDKSHSQQVNTITQSPWVFTTSVSDEISYNSKIEDMTSDVRFFSHDYPTYASTSSEFFSRSTNDHLSLQTTKNYLTMPTEFQSYGISPFFELNTDNSTMMVNSTEITTSRESTTVTSVTPPQTQLETINDNRVDNTDFHSKYFEPYSQDTDVINVSEISEYLLSTLPSTDVLLLFNTTVKASGVEYNKTSTSVLTFESQSSTLTMNLSLYTNHSFIQISTVLPDFKTTQYTTTIDFNIKTVPSMITSSSQRTHSDNAYYEIDTSFEDVLFSSSQFTETLTSYYPVMTPSSSRVLVSITTLSTNTIQSGLSEKNKYIIFFISTASIITIIIVIMILIFARRKMPKQIKTYRQKDENISRSTNSIPTKTAFPDYPFTGKHIHPLLKTSATSFKMHPYEHNWNDIV